MNLSTKLLLLASTLLMPSCVAANAIQNYQQDKELLEMSGRIHIVECRHIRATERAQVLRQREGFEVSLNLLELGIRQENGQLTKVECILFPADPEWTSFQAVARDYASWSLLHWRCSADLCRLGFPVEETAEVAFPAVPPGAYHFYVRYRLLDSTGSHTLRVRTSQVVVGEGGQVKASELEQESRTTRAAAGLENVI